MTPNNPKRKPKPLSQIARETADNQLRLEAGNIYGEIGERVAAKITGMTRTNTKGHDGLIIADRQEIKARPNLVGVEAGARNTYEKLYSLASAREAADYRKWLADGNARVQVKTRRLDPRYHLLDTRSGRPTDTYAPLVDLWIVILFAQDGDLVECRQATAQEWLDFVASNVGRGGAWNYKAAISHGEAIGTDRTAEARAAILSLTA